MGGIASLVHADSHPGWLDTAERLEVNLLEKLVPVANLMGTVLQPNQSGYRSDPRPPPKSTAEHQEHQNWAPQQWEKVTWSD